MILQVTIIQVSLFSKILCHDQERPLFTRPKKERPDLGPAIIEENEVQILTDDDWDENLMNYDVYLVLFYNKGKRNGSRLKTNFVILF